MQTAHGAKLQLGGCKETVRSCRPRRSLVEALEHKARCLLPAGSAGSSPEQGCRDSVHTSKDEVPIPLGTQSGHCPCAAHSRLPRGTA